MRLVKVYARVIQLLSVLSGSLFAWAFWYLLSNAKLAFDGPEPNSMAYFRELERSERLMVLSVGAFLILSCAGFLASLALYRGHNSGRVGVTAVLAGVSLMSAVDWHFEGVGRDLLTLAALVAFTAFSVWLLFFNGSVAQVFRTSGESRAPNQS